MGIRLIAGRSGSGKSTYIYEQVVKAAAVDPKQSYFVIVPDQFTMQTQMDIVKLSGQKGIMNIEVLSFSRLAHRVFEETGGHRRQVLDDTGKNLILQRVSAGLKDEIPYLAGKLNKPGYIHEVKSAISEFMQYSIDNTRMQTLIEYAESGNKLILKKKLSDLSVIYEHFKDYIRDRYITTEETQSILAKEIYRCHLLKDSTVIFDGFTGFTPVQNGVLEALMDVCKDIIFTLIADPEGLETETVNENDLFSFSRSTFLSLTELAKRHMEVIHIEPMPPGRRYAAGSELSFLEEHFLRYDNVSFGNDCHDIHLDVYRNIREEVRGLASRIRELARNNGAYYRDIAVITGNLDAYSTEIEEIFEEYGIPFYMDRNRGIVSNPFAEFVKSSLYIFAKNFSYESVFRYLRTGFSGVCREDVDRLDDYITATGIRGKSAYSRIFAKKSDNVSPDEADRIRMELMRGLSALTDAGLAADVKKPASEYAEALYEFIVSNDCASKLREYAEMFEADQDMVRAMEYSQIYRYTMHLLEQIHDLTGDELMNPAEFLKMLEAGFSEIEVGTIPQSVDRVIIGDMERTRLKPVKYLFFMGLNDGWVPKSTAKGGIISDGDREYLAGCDIELSPSPRNKIYIDRFYLYMNLTKPSDGLFLSYTGMDGDLNALRPSYIVGQLKGMFPCIDECIHDDRGISAVESEAEARMLYAIYMRRFADGTLPEDRKRELYILHGIVGEDSSFAERVFENAYKRYEQKSMDGRIAAILYGSRLYASVSRLETYAKCAYAYFLRYGLGLKPKEEYGLEATDLGSIYHGVLEIFVDLLKERGLDWYTFKEDDVGELIDEALTRMATVYTDAIMFESEQNKYILKRMKAIMCRTVCTLAYQLKQGNFKPYAYEYVFDGDLKNDDLTIRLNGKVDRVDIAEKDNSVFVKIVDYKSGAKEFSLLSFYTGMQLQMVVYMNRVVEKLKAQYPGKDVLPAAMLYYHIDDPMIESADEDSDEAIEKKILRSLRPGGVIEGNEEILLNLDKTLKADSDVIRIKRSKDGSFSGSEVLDKEDMRVISEYADHKLMELAGRMASGDIDTDPKEIMQGSAKQMDSCEYCDFKEVCGFDIHLPGCEKKILKEQTSTGKGSGYGRDELLADMIRILDDKAKEK